MRAFSFKFKSHVKFRCNLLTVGVMFFCFSSCIHDNENVINTSPIDSLKNVPGGIIYTSFAEYNDAKKICWREIGSEDNFRTNIEDILSDSAYNELSKYIGYTKAEMIFISENKDMVIIFPYEKTGRITQDDGYIFSSQIYTNEQMIARANGIICPRYYPVEQYRRISDHWMRFTLIGSRNDEYFGLFDE